MKAKNNKDGIITRSILREELDKEIAPVKKDLKSLKTEVYKISKNLDLFIKFFDKEQVKLKTRVDRVDTHLGLPPI